MTEYMESKTLADLAASVIEEEARFQHLDDPKCRIAYQMSTQEKKSNGKTVYADTERIKDKLKAFIPYDFLITFYQPNVNGLDNEKMRRLMYHELCHVGFDMKGNYSILPHDVEDFRDVVDKWGIDWI